MKKDYILAGSVAIGYILFCYGAVILKDALIYSVGLIIIFNCIFYKTFK